MKVLVTGATGFVGSHIVEALAAQGHQLRATVRASSDTGHLDKLGVELVRADLATGEGLLRAVAEVDAIVHCAGGGKVRTPADMHRNNVLPTRTLLDAALDVRRPGPPLRRFVLLSSLSAHGPSLDGHARAADEPARPVTAYGRSKLEAERLVIEVADRLPVTILRPPAIYGPRDTRMAPLFKWAARGVLPLVRSARQTSLVYGPDCAQAVARALEVPHPSGRTYFVEDGRPYAWTELVEHFSKAVGRPVRRVTVPAAAVKAVGAVNELVARALGRDSVLNRDKARDVTQSHWVCDASPLRDELGWRPTLRFDEGAAHTARWYRDAGWLR